MIADIRLILGLFVASRAVMLAMIGFGMIGNPRAVPGGIVDVICEFDCTWYLKLAEGGYVERAGVTADAVTNWVFFPALPLLIRLVAAATGLPGFWSGLLVANLAALAGFVLFHRYAADLGGPRFARFALALFSLWPAGMHQAAPMSEALFVPVSLAAFWSARRGYWLAAGLAAAALSSVRVVGVLAFPSLAWLAGQAHGWRRLMTLRPGTETAVLALALSGLGLGLYMLYLDRHVGDAFGFAHGQFGWDRQFKWPWLTALDEVNPLVQDWDWSLSNGFNLAVAAAAVVAAGFLWRRGLIAEALFVFATLGVASVAGSAVSLPRFVGALFPVPLALALAIERPVARAVALGVSGLALAAATFAWAWGSYAVM